MTKTNTPDASKNNSTTTSQELIKLPLTIAEKRRKEIDKKIRRINAISSSEKMGNLRLARTGHASTVVYYFGDGSTISAPINKEVFKTDRGSTEDLTKVLKIFDTTAWDIKAEAFDISC